jgi:hypothetical protein
MSGKAPENEGEKSSASRAAANLLAVEDGFGHQLERKLVLAVLGEF